MTSFPISLHLTTTTTRSRSSPLSFPFLNTPSPFLKIPGPARFRKAPKTAPLVLVARGSGFPLLENPLTGPFRAFDSLLRRGGVFLTATAVFLGCLSAPFLGNQLSSAIAAPVTVEAPESQTEEEKERYLEEYLDAHPDDVDALKALMEVKIKMGKTPEGPQVNCGFVPQSISFFFSGRKNMLRLRCTGRSPFRRTSRSLSDGVNPPLRRKEAATSAALHRRSRAVFSGVLST